MSRPKIAMLGLASENCTFSSGHTARQDFEVLEGDALRQRRYRFLEEKEFDEGEFVPLQHGRALPGGVITADTYRSLKESLLGALRVCLPVDAVYLDLHGAMHVEGLEDAEADLAGAVRALAGPECLLGASMDLHGNVSSELVRLVDLFSAYRTAPHIDTELTRARVCRLLLATLRHGWELERVWIPIPVLLPGEMTSTLDEPGQSLYAGIADLDDRPGILDVSLWVGYVWADERRAHASVVVCARRDAGDPAAVASELAARYWEARHDFRFNVPAAPIEECLDRALKERDKPVLISDSGDNPTAGGVGNLPLALREVCRRQAFSAGAKRVLVAGLWDAEAVSQCAHAGPGKEVELILGRHGDRRHAEPFPVRGVVEHVHEGDEVAGRQIVLRVGTGITVVLTERRKPFHHFRDFHDLDLRPETMDVVIVKIGYLVTDLREMAAAAYLALTPGAVDQHVTRLSYRNVRRPMFPFDEDFAWNPGDDLMRFYSRARKS